MFFTAYILLLSLTCKLVACNYTAVDSNLTFRSVAYYVNWAIYGRKFNPQDLPVDNLTHVIYAFAKVKPLTGEVYLSDTWADTDFHFPDDSLSEIGTNLYGCLKQLYLMKKKNRHLKVLLSIGGSSHDHPSNFTVPASTVSGRSVFASSAVTLVKNLGFDGLDIDWEFPADYTEATNMVLLLQSVREALDAYGNSLRPPYHFQLTVACPAGPSNYQQMHLTSMNKYVDFWNLMAWDYAGPWSVVAAHQANLFQSIGNPAATPFDTETAIQYYISQGIIPSKLVLGMPVYGRSFSATYGIGKPKNGTGKGTWEVGVYDFKDLPLTGAVEIYDFVTGSSYSYDSTTRELVSYDNVMVARQKAAWIRKMKLGGVVWWESSADAVGDRSLIRNTVSVLREGVRSGLETCSNELVYPNSTYDNLRAGMPDFKPLNSSYTSPCSAKSAGFSSTIGANTFLKNATLATESRPNKTTTTVTIPCGGSSKVSNLTATHETSSLASIEPDIAYTTVYTTTTLPFFTTVVTVVYATRM